MVGHRCPVLPRMACCWRNLKVFGGRLAAIQVRTLRPYERRRNHRGPRISENLAYYTLGPVFENPSLESVRKKKQKKDAWRPESFRLLRPEHARRGLVPRFMKNADLSVCRAVHKLRPNKCSAACPLPLSTCGKAREFALVPDRGDRSVAALAALAGFSSSSIDPRRPESSAPAPPRRTRQLARRAGAWSATVPRNFNYNLVGGVDAWGRRPDRPGSMATY